MLINQLCPHRYPFNPWVERSNYGLLKDTSVTAGIRTHILLLTPELESGKLGHSATTPQAWLCLIQYFFSECVLLYFGLFYVLNTDNPSASCHLLMRNNNRWKDVVEPNRYLCTMSKHVFSGRQKWPYNISLMCIHSLLKIVRTALFRFFFVGLTPTQNQYHWKACPMSNTIEVK